ncbi:MAG: FAD binding domain-containing protein [Chloroflexota bacterium]
MEPLEYHRPKTLEEALPLLQRARPLGGGTDLVPQRLTLASVVDLQDLGLDELEETQSGLRLGAMLRLQRLVEGGDEIPAALREACRLEGGLNLRNMATIAGTIVAADGRSPLTTVLLALSAQVRLEPGGETLPLDALLDRRGSGLAGRLIVALEVPPIDFAAYDQVARSPAGRPLVCVAVGHQRDDSDFRLALGGYGNRPIALRATRPDPAAAAEAAALAYAEAGDAWAGAEYRSAVAAVLVRWLMEEAVAR